MRELREGDYVVISEIGRRMYDDGAHNPHYAVGKLVEDQFHSGHRYFVRWSRTQRNCYCEGEIELAFKEEDY